MITSKILETVFGTPGRVAILRRLAVSPQPLSGRQLSELAGLSHRGAIQAISPLVDAGVVKQRKVGKAYQYSLSRANVVVREVILPSLEAESNLQQKLSNELKTMFSSYAVSIVLFGSYARGDQSTISDIDVMIIAPSAARKELIQKTADDAAATFSERYAAMLSVYVLTTAEFKGKKHTRLIKNIVRDGVLLYGKKLEDFIK